MNERIKMKCMYIFGSSGAGLASVSCVVHGLVNSLLCKLQRKGGHLRELRRVPRRVCVEARPPGETGRDRETALRQGAAAASRLTAQERRFQERPAAVRGPPAP